MKQQSELYRDVTDPGWREREDERNAKLLAAIPVKTDEQVRQSGITHSADDATLARIAELERERDRFRSALSDIALAGMSLPIEVGDDEEAKRSFHANQAWRFIQIAAIAISPDAALASEKEKVKNESI